ncbi:MAG: phosphatase PAP2 family protein, partial [Solirubrobacterales bacterium]
SIACCGQKPNTVAPKAERNQWLSENPGMTSGRIPASRSAAQPSIASATVATRISPDLAPAVFGLAALMALTRPYLGMHYPSDVLAGALLGTAFGLALPLPNPSTGA